jgi:hypothetical protein
LYPTIQLIADAQARGLERRDLCTNFKTLWKQMQIKTISMKEILDDFFFCFSQKPPSSILIESVRAEGILNPLRVQRTEAGFRLLAGFKRWLAARKVGLEDVPARIITDSMDVASGFFMALQAHHTHSHFTLVEKARILNITAAIDGWDVMEVEDPLSLLEIPLNKRIRGEMKSILDLDPVVLEYIEAYGLSLKQIDVFRSLDMTSQQWFAQLGMKENVRAVELGKIITMSRDICMRYDQEMAELIKELTPILNRNILKRDEKLNAIKAVLEVRLHPFTGKKTETLESLKSSLNLPENMVINWDKTLETPGLLLQYRLSKPDDIEFLIDHLRKTNVSMTLQEMIRVMM